MTHPEQAARRALALAGVGRDEQARILAEVVRRLDKQGARARRDYWLKIAHRLVGHVGILSASLHRYHAATWPALRHLAEPPAAEPPLKHAFFKACQAADDAGTGLPGERQLRRLVT